MPSWLDPNRDPLETSTAYVCKTHDGLSRAKPKEVVLHSVLIDSVYASPDQEVFFTFEGEDCVIRVHLCETDRERLIAAAVDVVSNRRSNLL